MNAAIAALTKTAASSSKTTNAANNDAGDGADQGSFGALLGKTIDAHRAADAADAGTASAADATAAAAATTAPGAAQDASAALLQALAALGLVPGQNTVVTQSAATGTTTDTATAADDAASGVSGRGRMPADLGLGTTDAKPRAGKTDLTATNTATADTTRDTTQAARASAKAALAATATELDAKAGARTDAAAADKPVASFAEVLGTLAANAGAASSATATTSQTPVAQHSLDARFGSTQWANDLTDKVRHFVLEKIEVAELKLNPQDLGPIRVEIALDQGNAAIHFSAARDDVRDALAQNIGNLRTALADAGVALQNASTGSFGDGQAFAFMQRQQSSDPGAARASGSGQAREADAAPAIAAAGARASNASANGVDLFA